LLDALQAADGTDQLIEVHRQVTGSSGIGETYSSYFQQKEGEERNKDESSSSGYLLVTGEDTVRGLHLDGLETVVVVGRANGPDEYTHIAGRTGRAGRPGIVINVLSHQHAAAVRGWEKMLNVDFEVLEMDDVAQLD
jgi:superfamily II DNA/RNA helicase